jgi:hypothetical protein
MLVKRRGSASDYRVVRACKKNILLQALDNPLVIVPL